MSEGPRQWWLPAPAWALLGSPAPLQPDCTCPQRNALAEIPQGFVPPGRKETRPAALACGQGSSGENWRPPLECPRDLSLLEPYFLGSQGVLWGDPLRAAQLPSWLCLAGEQQPQGPLCGCFRFSPSLSATVMLEGRLETLVLLQHEKQGPRGQSEGELMFHMSAPLRVVAVFILQAEMQDDDRECCHKMWPFFCGLG